MGNIVDYIREYGEESFIRRPFSEEDSLVLAQLSYLKLDGVVSGFEEKSVPVFVAEVRKRSEDAKIFADTLFAEENKALYDAVCRSRRFQKMKLNYYVNRIDLEKPSQFSAVTCFLEDGSVYVAFRGTDETLAGWREDFDMACQAPVKSQELSVEYLNRVADRCEGRLIIGGHSKGGNLAVYAAMHCKETVRKRICRIYNLDGPGFLPGCQESRAYEELAPRVRKLIPHASLVGMLFEDSGAYEVVESSGRGILQHDAFTWVIRQGKFVKVEEIYQSWKVTGEILNRWIASLSREQLKGITEELFSLLDAAQAETLLDFQGNWKKMVRRMAAALHDTDSQTRKAMWKVGKALFRAAGEVAWEHRA